MKLPEPIIGRVQTLGRNDLGAVGGVARAKAGLAGAEAKLMGTLADMSGRYIERKENMEHDSEVSRYMDRSRAWEEQWGVKEFASADEIEGMIPKGSVNLTESIPDGKGGISEVRRKNIPQYEWYGTAQNQYLQSSLRASVDNISNNNMKTAFTQNMNEYNGKKSLDAAIRSSQAQFKHIRTVVKARVEKQAKRGNLDEALIDIADNYEGTDSEKAALVAGARKEDEKFIYRESIRTEDLEAIDSSINTLQSAEYLKNGALNSDEAVAEVKKLRTAQTALGVKNGNSMAMLKASKRQEVEVMVKAMYNGFIPGVKDLGELGQQLFELGLAPELENLKFASKHAPGIHKLKYVSPKETSKYINEYSSQFKGAEQAVIREKLQSSAAKNRAAIENDTAQFMADNKIVDLPDVQDDKFWQKMMGIYLAGVNNYGVSSGFLTDAQTVELSQKMGEATPNQKADFARDILGQVPLPLAEIVFKQLGYKNVPDMVVIADMARRGNDADIKLLVQGAAIRSDPNQKVMPPMAQFTDVQVSLVQLYPDQPTMQSYVMKGVLDVYAGLTTTPGLLDDAALEDAQEIVMGSRATFNNNIVILPEDIDESQFRGWGKRIDPAYIEKSGGVEGMDATTVVGQINEGHFKLINTPDRGVYLIETNMGLILGDASSFEANRNDPTVPAAYFRLVFDESAVIARPLGGPIIASQKRQARRRKNK